MRPEVRNAVKFIHRARRALEQSDSTTVEETIALVKAVAGLRANIMLLGDRARRALERQQEVEN